MGGIFWAISASIFALLEIIVPGLITIWLALAAFVVTLIAGLINNSYIEFFIFSILSLVFILFTRPVLQSYIKSKRKNDFSSSMAGSEIKIEKVINTENSTKEYEVRFKGSIWTGISEEFFKVGERVVIKSFEGNKIILGKK